MAVLEDAKGLGKQFVVSQEGFSSALDDIKHCTGYLKKWQEDLNFKRQDFPSIQQLFYLAYEAGMLFESLPKPKTKLDGPLVWRHEPQWSVCFDAEQAKVFISSIQSEVVLDKVEAMLLHTASSMPPEVSLHVQPEEHRFDYQQAVCDVKAYIQAGDIFQANIARFWSATMSQDKLLPLYAKLRVMNPAPFSCFVKVDDLTIVSASPERLFSISAGGEVAARPIAGTRKRSQGHADHALQDELLLSEKERAEHIMLVDLERNDLGRVCEAGSIHVDECMVIEKYATVQHIVSNVKGQLKQGLGFLDVLAAKFPGGTITGCPKVRCMEIIRELEPQARSVYTGGVGYVAWDGSVDMNILIRSFWHQDNTLNWAAGAGIVADSDPEHEQIETEHKVAGLLRAFHD